MPAVFCQRMQARKRPRSAFVFHPLLLRSDGFKNGLVRNKRRAHPLCSHHAGGPGKKPEKSSPPLRIPHFDLRKFGFPAMFSNFSRTSTQSNSAPNENAVEVPQRKDLTRAVRLPSRLSETPFLNRLLASRRVAMSFVVCSGVLYVVSCCLIARAISSNAVLGHHRVLLLGLGILLPDFRHTLRLYSEAVASLQKYKPALDRFRMGRKLVQDLPVSTEQFTTNRDGAHKEGWESKPELAWAAQAMSFVRNQIHANSETFDEILSRFSRDVSRPILETSTQIQQLTIGTDLTLRKNVIVTTASIILSIIGYLVSALSEPNIGGVAIMLACLLPKTIMSSRRHEMLALIDDVRAAVALVGTLLCVVSVFFPISAAYIFLLCCIALVVSRIPIEWLLGW